MAWLDTSITHVAQPADSISANISFSTGKGGVVYPVEKRRRPVFTSTVVTYPPPPSNASRIQVVVVLPLVPVMP